VDVLIAVATIGVPVANVAMQVLLVPASLADVLAAIFSGGVVTDVTRVLPNVATILTNVGVVAAKLAGVVMDITLVRANIARFAMRHARVKGRVLVVDVLCADEVRTSNEQGCGNGSHSEIAHGFSQRQYRAVASMACAAYTTLARTPTLSATFDDISMRQVFPGQSFRLRACIFA
jgi:hypothetical protein